MNIAEKIKWEQQITFKSMIFHFLQAQMPGFQSVYHRMGAWGTHLPPIGHKSSLVVSCGSLMQVPNRNLQYLMLNSQLFIVIDQKKQHKCRDFSQFTIGWGRGGLTYHLLDTNRLLWCLAVVSCRFLIEIYSNA